MAIYEVTLQETSTKTITAVFTVEAEDEKEAATSAIEGHYKDFEVIDDGDPEYTNPIVEEVILIES